MDKFDKIQQLHRIFVSHQFPVTISKIAEQLECTKPTAKKAIDLLRDQLNAPLHYHEAAKGWQYDKSAGLFELPGLWLTANELHGLATILHVLHSMDEGLLGNEISIVQQQVEKLLNAKGVDIGRFSRVIKYLSINKRPVISHYFSTIVDALINQYQLLIQYQDYSGNISQRIISPQTLIHYQENWYLDAWCHKRCAIIELEALKQHYQTSYGIFAGTPKYTAQLTFYPPVANEAASIQWHPDQMSEWQDDNYQLNIPYNDDRELVRDILQYGNHVEVIKPAALKNKIKKIAQGLVSMYSV